MLMGILSQKKTRTDLMPRLHPHLRKESILEAAIVLAEATHYRELTRDGVASAAEVSAGLVNRYFGTIEILKHTVIERAVSIENLKIIAQAVVEGNALVFSLTSDSLRRKALKAANEPGERY
jgi:AcrR family transcriptional regulator